MAQEPRFDVIWPLSRKAVKRAAAAHSTREICSAVVRSFQSGHSKLPAKEQNPLLC